VLVNQTFISNGFQCSELCIYLVCTANAREKTLVNNKIIISSLITMKLNVEVKHRHTINFIILLLIELIIKEATVIIL